MIQGRRTALLSVCMCALAASAAERLWDDGAEHVITCADYYTEGGSAWPGIWKIQPPVSDWRGYDRLAVDVVNGTEGRTRFCWGVRMDGFTCEGEERIDAYSHRLLVMSLALPEGKSWPQCVSNMFLCAGYPHAGEFRVRNAWLLKPGEPLPLIDTSNDAGVLVGAIQKRMAKLKREREDERANTYGQREHFAAYLAFRDACEKAGQRGGMLIGSATGMEKILPRGKTERPLRPAEALAIRLARGEYESVQVLVAPRGNGLRNVRVCVGELRREDGGTFPASNVLAAVTGYVCVREQACYRVGRDEWRDGDYRRKAVAPGYGWYPDPILAYTDRTDIASTDVQSFWLRFHAPRGQEPGTYRGTVSVTADGEEPRTLALTVRVNSFTLPATSPLPTMITFAPWIDKSDRSWPGGHLEAMSGPESPVTLWSSRKREWTDFLSDYYITLDNIYRRNDEPDLGVFRRLEERGRLGLVNVGNWNTWKDAADESVWRTNTLARLKTSYERIKAAGWADRAYLYGADEVPADRLSGLRACVETLKREFPGVPIVTTAYDHSLGLGSALKDVDWFVAQLHFWNPDKVLQSRRAGHQVWWYTCNVPAGEYPNMFLESQAIETRLLMGALTQKYRPDGFLFYQIAKWSTPRCVTGGPFTGIEARTWGMYNGEACWTCVGEGGRPLPTMRLENYRDGLEDLAYAKLLEHELAERRRADETWVREARELLSVPRSVAKSLTDYADDPAALDAWRNRMADLLEGGVIPGAR